MLTSGAIGLAIPAEIAGAEIHREGGRGLPLDVLALGGEGRVLVQHRVGGILALADLQHALEHRLALGACRSRSPERPRACSSRRWSIRRPAAAGLAARAGRRSSDIGSLKAALFDQSRTARVGRRSRRSAASSRCISICTLRPTARHISTSDLRRRDLVGVVVVEQAVRDRIALVVGCLQQRLRALAVVLRHRPVRDEHRRRRIPTAGPAARACGRPTGCRRSPGGRSHG